LARVFGVLTSRALASLADDHENPNGTRGCEHE
jgi:hypothetical protein